MHVYIYYTYNIHTFNAVKMCLSAPCMKIASCGDAHAHIILRGDDMAARFVSQQLRRPLFYRVARYSFKPCSEFLESLVDESGYGSSIFVYKNLGLSKFKVQHVKR